MEQFDAIVVGGGLAGAAAAYRMAKAWIYYPFPPLFSH